MSTITINVPAGQDSRVAHCVGRRLGLVDGSNVPRDATGSEVKQYLSDQLKLCVLEVEKSEAHVAADAGVSPITPS